MVMGHDVSDSKPARKTSLSGNGLSRYHQMTPPSRQRRELVTTSPLENGGQAPLTPPYITKSTAAGHVSESVLSTRQTTRRKSNELSVPPSPSGGQKKEAVLGSSPRGRGVRKTKSLEEGPAGTTTETAADTSPRRSPRRRVNMLGDAGILTSDVCQSDEDVSNDHLLERRPRRSKLEQKESRNGCDSSQPSPGKQGTSSSRSRLSSRDSMKDDAGFPDKKNSLRKVESRTEHNEPVSTTKMKSGDACPSPVRRQHSKHKGKEKSHLLADDDDDRSVLSSIEQKRTKPKLRTTHSEEYSPFEKDSSKNIGDLCLSPLRKSRRTRQVEHAPGKIISDSCGEISSSAPTRGRRREKSEKHGRAPTPRASETMRENQKLHEEKRVKKHPKPLTRSKAKENHDAAQDSEGSSLRNPYDSTEDFSASTDVGKQTLIPLEKLSSSSCEYAERAKSRMDMISIPSSPISKPSNVRLLDKGHPMDDGEDDEEIDLLSVYSTSSASSKDSSLSTGSSMSNRSEVSARPTLSSCLENGKQGTDHSVSRHASPQLSPRHKNECGMTLERGHELSEHAYCSPLSRGKISSYGIQTLPFKRLSDGSSSSDDSQLQSPGLSADKFNGTNQSHCSRSDCMSKGTRGTQNDGTPKQPKRHNSSAAHDLSGKLSNLYGAEREEGRGRPAPPSRTDSFRLSGIERSTKAPPFMVISIGGNVSSDEESDNSTLSSHSSHNSSFANRSESSFCPSVTECLSMGTQNAEVDGAPQRPKRRNFSDDESDTLNSSQLLKAERDRSTTRTASSESIKAHSLHRVFLASPAGFSNGVVERA